MADNSRHSSHQPKDLVLVPAWDKASIAELGERAMPVMIDGYGLDDDYGRAETVKMPPQPR